MRRSDVPEVTRLRREFDRFLAGLRATPGRQKGSARSAAALLRDAFGTRALFRSIVATRGGRPVGYVFYHMGFDPDEMQGPVLHVIDLYVTAAERRTGVGSLLMKAAAEVCRKAGGIALYFGVWRRNTLAVSFYRRLGASWIRDVPYMRWPRQQWPD